jgi:hypothetical protein
MTRKAIRSNSLVFPEVYLFVFKRNNGRATQYPHYLGVNHAMKIFGNKFKPMLIDIFCNPATFIPRVKGHRVQACVMSLNVGSKTGLSKKLTLKRNG